jgi:hypothetical protein
MKNHELKEIAIFVGLGIVILFSIVLLDGHTNNKLRINCESKGGVWNQSVDPSHSFCQFTGKN